ncbi:MmcQ/YjbR family DNA-binding protein [Maribacter sp. 2307ULW6-5]|uniref:MmcQ/YjbR family DNA-binding protein n=1 Tax=Maribacter sp. 2307ULW6-5 TaxID=3386275 RepID=UPI0039BC5051
MNVEELRTYCLAKKGVTEGFPFDDVTLVFKVMGKMFALCGLERMPPQVNLKCDPERAIQLREAHPEIIAGWHMSKVHWNTVYMEQLDPALTRSLIDHSYALVVAKLTKKMQAALAALS